MPRRDQYFDGLVTQPFGLDFGPKERTAVVGNVCYPRERALLRTRRAVDLMSDFGLNACEKILPAFPMPLPQVLHPRHACDARRTQTEEHVHRRLAQRGEVAYDRAMELRHLRYFAAVAAHGSFSRAAEILNITQPPLSRQVKDLEHQLGVPLLVRGTNSVTLTDAGELFYQEALEVLEMADRAVRRVQVQSRQEALRVGYAPSLTTGIMTSALSKFQTAQPGVRIELSDLSSKQTEEIVAGGRFDMILIPEYFGPEKIEGFQFHKLISLKPVLVIPKQHPMANLKEIPIGRMHNLPLVGLSVERYPEYIPAIHGVFEGYDIKLNFVSLVDNGICPLFEELITLNAPTVLNDGIASILPRSMVMRPFAPRLPLVSVMLGLPTTRPKPHAEIFARLLNEEAGARTRKGLPKRSRVALN